MNDVPFYPLAAFPLNRGQGVCSKPEFTELPMRAPSGRMIAPNGGAPCHRPGPRPITQGLTNEVRALRGQIGRFAQPPVTDRGEGSRLTEARDRLGLDRDRPHPGLARDRRRGHQSATSSAVSPSPPKPCPSPGAANPRCRSRRRRSEVVDCRASSAVAPSLARNGRSRRSAKIFSSASAAFAAFGVAPAAARRRRGALRCFSTPIGQGGQHPPPDFVNLEDNRTNSAASA